MAAASAAGSKLAVDLTSASLLRHPMTQDFLDALRADGTPWRFGTDDPTAFLHDHGWSITDLKQPGEPGVGQGRWPYRVHPTEIAGVPRNWLARATRSHGHQMVRGIAVGARPQGRPLPRSYGERVPTTRSSQLGDGYVPPDHS
jgi:hypothetical protein